MEFSVAGPKGCKTLFNAERQAPAAGYGRTTSLLRMRNSVSGGARGRDVVLAAGSGGFASKNLAVDTYVY
jgi:hypothetical protein